MKIIPLGRIFDPRAYGFTHAQTPVPIWVSDRIRILFSSRDSEGRSQIFWVDVDGEDPTRIVAVAKAPALARGPAGAFDEDGVMPGSLIREKDGLALYYTGWNRKVSTPYHNAIGRCLSRDDGATFTREFLGPVLDRTSKHPFLNVTPTVSKSSTGYEIICASGTGWHQIGKGWEPAYVLYRGISSNGIDWNLSQAPLVQSEESGQISCAGTRVVLGNQNYLIYCTRLMNNYRGGSGSYRLAIAKPDSGGETYTPVSEFDLNVGRGNWDSEMRAYPSALVSEKYVLIFYNGNGFGVAGFGALKISIP
jgi:hypothetical protein